jgi:predicted MFS family arabinose efflux permease
MSLGMYSKLVQGDIGAERRALSESAAVLVLLAGVGVAFADSSIVVLALPDLLQQFDLSIMSVTWSVIAYNFALTVVAFALARLARSHRLQPALIARAGAALFLVSSLACAAAPSIGTLVAARTVQGAAASSFLVGSLPLLRSATCLARANRLWVAAGVVGAALGPAAGGFLTQVFSWRAIFLAQAPIAALALIGTMRRCQEEPAARQGAGRLSRRQFRADLALMLVSAALVGLLFLSVILLVDVWRFTPVAAAAVVSTIPLATVAAQVLAARLEGPGAAGGVLLAGGLLALALLPARSLPWAVAALALAGFGVGLLLPRLTRDVLIGEGSLGAAARTIWIRHIGLVAGLLILTPLLTADLSAAGTSAKLRGIAVVLDAPVSGATKLKLALDLAPVLSRPAAQGLPNFAAAVAPHHDSRLTLIGRRLDHVVQSTVARGFRRAFLVAAFLGLLAVAPGIVVRRRHPLPPGSRLLLPALAVSAVAGLTAGEIASGAASFGEHPRLPPPCAARARPPDGVRQQFVLQTLDAISCQLHETSEELVLQLAQAGRGGLLWQLLAGGGSLSPSRLLRLLIGTP